MDTTVEKTVVEIGAVRIKRLPAKTEIPGRYAIVEIGQGNAIVGVYKHHRHAKETLARRYQLATDRDERRPRIGKFIDATHVALDIILP